MLTRSQCESSRVVILDRGKKVGDTLAPIAGVALAVLAGGSTIGQAVDTNFLDNHGCLACGYAFGAKPNDVDRSAKAAP